MGSFYPRLSLAPRRLEAMQTIGFRIVSGTPTYVKNKIILFYSMILLQQSRTNKIQDNIRTQARAMFYNNSKSIYPHLQGIGHLSATYHTTNKGPSNTNHVWRKVTPIENISDANFSAIV